MRTFINASYRRQRVKTDVDGGRPGRRSAIPLAVLGVCMAAVLYSNVAHYPDQSSTASTAVTTPAGKGQAYSVDNVLVTDAIGEGHTPSESREPRTGEQQGQRDGDRWGEESAAPNPSSAGGRDVSSRASVLPKIELDAEQVRVLLSAEFEQEQQQEGEAEVGQNRASTIITAVAKVAAENQRAVEARTTTEGWNVEAGWGWDANGAKRGEQVGEGDEPAAKTSGPASGASGQEEEGGAGDDRQQPLEEGGGHAAVAIEVKQEGHGADAGWDWPEVGGENGGVEKAHEDAGHATGGSGQKGHEETAEIDQIQPQSQLGEEREGATTLAGSPGKREGGSSQGGVQDHQTPNNQLEVPGGNVHVTGNISKVGGEILPRNPDEESTEPTEDGEVNAGLPPNGALQGAMKCTMTKEGAGAGAIVNIATWKDVPGDKEYRGPFFREATSSLGESRYVTLEKDLGGFNNIRLTLESAVAFAAATGRTFVIPPPYPIWNMNTFHKHKEVSLNSVFSFDKLAASGCIQVITTEEFFEREVFTGKLGIAPSEGAKRLSVKHVSAYLTQAAGQYEKGLPDVPPEKGAIIMPRRMGERVDLEAPEYTFAKEWLFQRELMEYREGWQTAKVIHWRSKGARLLTPFYGFVLHADEVAQRYYSRLIRDNMHYPEEVYCKASQVVSLIKAENSSGSFSSMHIRRNDFVGFYRPTALDAETILANSEDHLIDGETLYIATDERNRSFFEAFHERFKVRFLSDYYEKAGVSEMGPNYVGMIEQVIASNARTFTGCWFSTFTAYILRLRGYYGYPRTSNFYYFLPKKTNPHTSLLPKKPLWSTEWAFGWEGIDDTGIPDSMAP